MDLYKTSADSLLVNLLDLIFHSSDDIKLLESEEDQYFFEINSDKVTRILISKWDLITCLIKLIRKNPELSEKFTSIMVGFSKFEWGYDGTKLTFPNKKGERDAKIILWKMCQEFPTFLSVLKSLGSKKLFSMFKEFAIQVEVD